MVAEIALQRFALAAVQAVALVAFIGVCYTTAMSPLAFAIFYTSAGWGLFAASLCLS